MTITSISFVLFVFCGALLYYIIPKKLQWVELLILSVAFYFLSTTPYTIIYLILSTVIAYSSTMIMECAERKGKSSKVSSAAMGVAVSLNILLWVIFKSKSLWSTPIKIFLRFAQIEFLENLLDIELLGALGMGYYTFQVISYILDCYWGTSKVQKNPLKLLLFVVYFPQLTSGPISKYSQLQSLYEAHSFDYNNMVCGVERFIWGLAKKMVLAERVAVLIQNLQLQADEQGGFFVILTILLFPLQIYADFGGCVDIILGVSQIFGITLPENFNNPFFSRSTQEFWQRWHITLGAFAKDYILYPVLRSKGMRKLTKACKNKFGKKQGRLVATAIGTLAPWAVIALWHGSWRFLVGILLWNWGIITLTSFLAPLYKKAEDKLHINTESALWHFFQSARTYVLYAIGVVFFNRGVGSGLRFLKKAAISLIHPVESFEVLSLSNILSETFTFEDLMIIFIMIMLLFIVASYRETYGYARVWLNSRFVLVKWFIIIALTLFVVISAKYGSGYDASAFIYQGF